MPGAKEVGDAAFENCHVLTDVECGKLEIIRERAFGNCQSLRSINMPSARIVARGVFGKCKDLKDVKFGNKLERIEGYGTFSQCVSLERITIPLKDNLITVDSAFIVCRNLMHVDLADEGAVLLKTIAALQLEEWRNDMNEEIDSINHILPITPAGYVERYDDYDEGEKAQAIRSWISSVLGKINHYKAEHRRILSEAAATLQLFLPQDIAMNNIVPFLELPVQTFEGEVVAADDNDE